MIECIIYDETEYNPPTAGPMPSAWTQEFSRVPCAGEYVVTAGMWLKVHSVAWRGSTATLCVKWDGGLD
jgi:hypothetical protein